LKLLVFMTVELCCLTCFLYDTAAHVTTLHVCCETHHFMTFTCVCHHMYLCSYISIFIWCYLFCMRVILCYAHEMTLQLIRVNMNWSKAIIRLLIQIDAHIFMHNLQLFVCVHYTHHWSNPFFFAFYAFLCSIVEGIFGKYGKR